MAKVTSVFVQYSAKMSRSYQSGEMTKGMTIELEDGENAAEVMARYMDALVPSVVKDAKDALNFVCQEAL